MEIFHKAVEFKFTEPISDAGAFVGLASVYGEMDLGGDVVQKQAFQKSIADQSKVPILWQHRSDDPIGVGTIEDGETGLILHGQLALEVAQAREARALVKAGVIRGLSIGFQTIKDEISDGVRYLKEVKLWEVSLVTFPMLPSAMIQAIKAGRKLSAASRAEIEAAIATLQALLAEELTDAPDPEPKAARPVIEPDPFHSLNDLPHLIKELRHGRAH